MPEEVLETPQPTQPTESKSTDWTKIILAAVIGLGLLAGAAYAGYYYGTQQVQQPEKPAPVVSPPTTKPTPTPTPSVENETIGWNTYMYPSKTGESYEVKYPQDWSYFEASGVEGTSVTFQKGQYSETNFSPETNISIGRTANASKVSLDQWLLDNNILPRSGDPVIEVSEVVVGGIRGKQLISAKDGGRVVYLAYGNYVFKITETLTGGDIEQTKEVFDQILSTFRFLE